MATIPFYATSEDIKDIIKYINDQEDLAYIVADGPNKWIAKNTVDILEATEHFIWHIPSGPLPLLREVGQDPLTIDEPFKGWTQLRNTGNLSLPYFGPGHPGVFQMDLYNHKSPVQPEADYTNLSRHSLGWIGNHYKILGNGAKEITEKRWKSLRKWVQKQSKKVPYGGPNYVNGDGQLEVYAFKDAQRLFAEGKIANVNP